ncbi:hypothetical protein FQB35_10005 [Crassaminicella thermophila]|uniref:Uncharacterized protein n=1 Tax=Crassaminicella thermophila TaxID=2599308 RepID=A0A5C0SGV0_CRATE|nr:hypothetical protein [Crassaminicella thermophila]QEK12634.1 hypothetical protein FQB35_10005 [Crassaminicella thermophila]
MENKLLQQILEKLNSIDARIANLEQGQAKLEQGQAKLEQGQAKLEQNQQKIKEHLIQLDTKNANNHIEIKTKIDKLSQDLTVIEAVSGKNLSDIAYLKSIK